ncbi:hypothetical protein [Lactobacillus rhamnosus DSM 14870] [Lacticaseibacillus rhamnosus]|nr:hypothetical protein [Lactobacillus rhamnosus DSM 14870] [Lacticaseibacillus rhamnosus]
MWLRDATFQVLPYVQLVKAIPDLEVILKGCLLYTSDAADEGLGVDLGGRRIIKKKKKKKYINSSHTKLKSDVH